MPYIKSLDRAQLDTLRCAQNSGELNYELTKVIQRYISNQGASYRTMNDVIGALESCKLEFYRRIVAPHENMKIQQNGDVYK